MAMIIWNIRSERCEKRLVGDQSGERSAKILLYGKVIKSMYYFMIIIDMILEQWAKTDILLFCFRIRNVSQIDPLTDSSVVSGVKFERYCGL